MNIRSGSRIVTLLALLALALGLAACGAPATTTPLRAARAENPTEAPASVQAASAQGPTLGTLDIHSVDLGFQPTSLKVEQPGRYTVNLINDGAIQHDISFPDGTKLLANPKETKTADVEVPASGLSFICSIPGHADAGMKGAITVAGSSASAHNADDHGGPMPTNDVQPDDKAPPPTLYDATAPPRWQAQLMISIWWLKRRT